MGKITDFLKECGVFYLASVHGTAPRLRPLGFFMEYEGKLYFGIGNNKEVYHQLQINPQFEICCTSKDNKWLRLRGKAMFDESPETLAAAYKAMPMLETIYADPKGSRFIPFAAARFVATIDDMCGGHEEIHEL